MFRPHTRPTRESARHGLPASTKSRTRRTAARQLILESLEDRRLLAIWTYRIDKAGDDVTLGFNSARTRYEITDTATGGLLASRNAGGNLTGISVIGKSAPDTLRI